MPFSIERNFKWNIAISNKVSYIKTSSQSYVITSGTSSQQFILEDNKY